MPKTKKSKAKMTEAHRRAQQSKRDKARARALKPKQTVLFPKLSYKKNERDGRKWFSRPSPISGIEHVSRDGKKWAPHFKRRGVPHQIFNPETGIMQSQDFRSFFHVKHMDDTSATIHGRQVIKNVNAHNEAHSFTIPFNPDLQSLLPRAHNIIKLFEKGLLTAVWLEYVPLSPITKTGMVATYFTTDPDSAVVVPLQEVAVMPLAMINNCGRKATSGMLSIKGGGLADDDWILLGDAEAPVTRREFGKFVVTSRNSSVADDDTEAGIVYLNYEMKLATPTIGKNTTVLLKSKSNTTIPGTGAGLDADEVVQAAVKMAKVVGDMEFSSTDEKSGENYRTSSTSSAEEFAKDQILKTDELAKIYNAWTAFGSLSAADIVHIDGEETKVIPPITIMAPQPGFDHVPNCHNMYSGKELRALLPGFFQRHRTHDEAVAALDTMGVVHISRHTIQAERPMVIDLVAGDTSTNIIQQDYDVDETHIIVFKITNDTNSHYGSISAYWNPARRGFVICTKSAYEARTAYGGNNDRFSVFQWEDNY